MAESPTLDTPEDGAPTSKPTVTLYCEVNACRVIMPRNETNASNGKYGEGERLSQRNPLVYCQPFVGSGVLTAY
jgi:hypothetical protein